MPLLPIYGGFATTASYCAASNSACCTSGPNRLSASRHKEVLAGRLAQLLELGKLVLELLRHLNQRPKRRRMLKELLNAGEVLRLEVILLEIDAVDQLLHIQVRTVL